FVTEPVVGQIRVCRPDRAIASPAFLERLAIACAKSGVTLPSVRAVFTGGGPIFPRLLARLNATAPNAKVVAIYGSTEAEPISRLAQEEIRGEDYAGVAAGSGLLAGVPVPEVQLRILPDRWL